MKTLLVVSVSALLLAGCMKVDMDDCPYNAMLTFRYYGDETSDEFAKMIDGVTLFVFSKEGRLVTTECLTAAALRAYQGINLKLEPGQYRFVCWGNAFECTEFRSENDLPFALLQHPNLAGGIQIPTHDPLYFGSCDLDLPKNDIIMGEVCFAGAHINLEIYTKGAGSSAQVPTIEVQNLSSQYDFTMSVTDRKITCYPEVKYDPEKKAAVARMKTLRFPDDNPVLIDIKSPQDCGQSITVVNLKAFMAANNIHVDGIHEATVRVLVEFTDMGVNITIPDWKNEEIDPEGPGYN